MRARVHVHLHGCGCAHAHVHFHGYGCAHVHVHVHVHAHAMRMWHRLMCATGACTQPPWIWRAPDWRNTSSYTVERAAGGRTIEGEDPFLYIDPRSPGVLHAVRGRRNLEPLSQLVPATIGGIHHIQR